MLPCVCQKGRLAGTRPVYMGKVAMPLVDAGRVVGPSEGTNEDCAEGTVGIVDANRSAETVEGIAVGVWVCSVCTDPEDGWNVVAALDVGGGR